MFFCILLIQGINSVVIESGRLITLNFSEEISDLNCDADSIGADFFVKNGKELQCLFISKGFTWKFLVDNENILENISICSESVNCQGVQAIKVDENLNTFLCLFFVMVIALNYNRRRSVEMDQKTEPIVEVYFRENKAPLRKRAVNFEANELNIREIVLLPETLGVVVKE